VLSFWPSLSLLAFCLVIFLECRAVGGRVTIPLGGFLAFFVYGCVGASLFSLLLQQIPYLQFASVPNAQGVPIMPAAWWTGPPIEEFSKALPVIVLAFLTTAWRRLSIADLTLAGFASGAGFGFIESNLATLVNGKLPGSQHLFLFGYQSAQSATGDYVTNFAGHAVYPALFALAAGIGLRLYPIRRLYAWIPAAVVFVVACFDHGMYNWKILHPAAAGGAFLDAATPVEILYLLTFHGRIEVWLLPVVLIAAQFVEGRLCADILGRRADMVLPDEYRQWVLNEWFVAILRLPYGCSAFDHTLAFFRRRRAFAIAALEASRNPANRPHAQYTRLLEQRVIQEQAILLAPPRGDWLPPRAVFERNLKEWTWRMRWVLPFNVLFVLLFMLRASQLPAWLSGFLFGDAFTAAVVASGIAFVAWRIYLFFRSPRLDPVASEGAVYADYHARILLLTASLASGLAPALSVLFGWAGLAHGTAYLSGYFAGWIGQGGNLYSVMGLGAMGGALEADPGPIGGALRDEIEAGEARIRRLERQYQKKISLALPSAARESVNLNIEDLTALIAQLDAERDMQGRRKRALEACERQAAETQVENLGRAVEAAIEEFERLRVEFDTAMEAEQRRLAAFEQGFDRYIGQIERELDSYDASNAELRESLYDLWRPNKDMDWALRIAQSTDEETYPVLKSFIGDLEAFAARSEDETADVLEAGIARLRAYVTPFVREEEAAAAPAPAKPDVAPAAPELPNEPEEPEEPEEQEAAEVELATPEPEEAAAAQETQDIVAAEAGAAVEQAQEPVASLEQPVAAPADESLDIAWEPVEADEKPAAPVPESAPLDIAEDTPAEPDVQEFERVASEEPEEVAPVVPEPAAAIEAAPVQSEIPQAQKPKREKPWEALSNLLRAIRQDDYDRKAEPAEATKPQTAQTETPAVEAVALAHIEDLREPWAAPQIQQLPAEYKAPAQPELDRAKEILDAEIEAALDAAARAPEIAGADLPICINAPGWSLEEAETARVDKPRTDATPASTHRAEWLEAHGDLRHPDTAGAPMPIGGAEAEEPWHSHLKEFVDLSREHVPEPQPDIIAEPEAPPLEPDLPRVEDKTRIVAYEPVSTKLRETVAPSIEPDLPRVEDKTRVVAYQPVSTQLRETVAPPIEPDLPRVEDKTQVVTYVPVPAELPEKAKALPEPAPAAAPAPKAVEAPAQSPKPAPEVSPAEPAKGGASKDLDDILAKLIQLETSTRESTKHQRSETREARHPEKIEPPKTVPPPAQADKTAASGPASKTPPSAESRKPAAPSVPVEVKKLALDSAPVPAADAAKPVTNDKPNVAAAKPREPIEAPSKPAAAVPPPAIKAPVAPPAAAAAKDMPARSAAPVKKAKGEAPAKDAAKPPADDFAAAIRAIETSPILVDMPQSVPAKSEPPHGEIDFSQTPFGGLDIPGDPLASPEDAEETPPEAKQHGKVRGLGRGKFARAGGDKKAASAQQASSVSFRPTKFYGGTNASKADPEDFDRTPAQGKKAPARSASAPASVSFRPTKFYGNASKGEADDASVAVKEKPKAQQGGSSIRASKFYNSGGGGDLEEADRTPAAANANVAASAKSLLAEALTEYFAEKGETPPPMHTVDSETLEDVIDSGRLETTKRGAQPWSYSGIPRRGDFAIRLKRGSDRYIEFVPSNVTFGQTPRYYARRVGVGTAQTYIPVEHLEYFDAGAREWMPLKR
jgi:hypothetical protein